MRNYILAIFFLFTPDIETPNELCQLFESAE